MIEIARDKTFKYKFRVVFLSKAKIVLFKIDKVLAIMIMYLYR